MLERGLAVASLLIGLPGFFLLFWSADVTIPIVLLILAALAGGGWYYAHFVSNQPPFTVLDNETTLSFEEGVRIANLEKRYTIRANVRDQKHISFRNNSSDGVFEAAYNDNTLLPPESLTSEAGDLRVSIRLTNSPLKGDTFVVPLKLRWRDAFTEKDEALIYQPDLPTKRATLRVVFPPGIPCRESYSRVILGIGESDYKAPTVSPDGTSISIQIKRPKIGVEYKLGWRWDLPDGSS